MLLLCAQNNTVKTTDEVLKQTKRTFFQHLKNKTRFPSESSSLLHIFILSDSDLFETLAVPQQDVLTHQFLDQRVGAPVQLSQEAQAEALHQSQQ